MSLDLSTIQSAALELPIPERVQLAQALWESIDQTGEGFPVTAELRAELKRRDAELSSGIDRGRSHEEVMKAARRAIGCE